MFLYLERDKEKVVGRLFVEHKRKRYIVVEFRFRFSPGDNCRRFKFIPGLGLDPG